MFTILMKHSFIIPQANDSYLQMAIGNAPWPIGVTMVGIHARTGREKIFAQNVARILLVIVLTFNFLKTGIH